MDKVFFHIFSFYNILPRQFWIVLVFRLPFLRTRHEEEKFSESFTEHREQLLVYEESWLEKHHFKSVFKLKLGKGLPSIEQGIWIFITPQKKTWPEIRNWISHRTFVLIRWTEKNGLCSEHVANWINCERRNLWVWSQYSLSLSEKWVFLIPEQNQRDPSTWSGLTSSDE